MALSESRTLTSGDSEHLNDHLAIHGLLNDAYPDTTVAWETWTPTLTNITVGNGTQVARYFEHGKTVFFLWTLTFGSTSAFSGEPLISLPVTASTTFAAVSPVVGNVRITDSGTATFLGAARLFSTTVVAPWVSGVGSTYATATTINATTPMTWTTGDKLAITGWYEAA